MKQRKLVVLIGSACLILVLASLPFMAACAAPAPAPPTPAPAPTPAPTPPPPPKPIELGYAIHSPAPQVPPAKAPATVASMARWAEEVEAKTQGRVKVKPYWGAVLGKPTEYLKMVGGVGVADVGNIVGSYNTWEVPLFCGAQLAFLTTDLDVEVRALHKLYDEWAPMREEWVKHNVKPLWWFVVDPYWLAIKKPITKLDDLKGEKIWGAGGFGDIVEMFGITQTAVTGPEAYDALQKGVLQGVVFPYGPIKIFKYDEVCKFFVDTGFCGAQTPNAQVINLDVWDSISPADQKVIEEVSAGMHDWFLRYYEEVRKSQTEYYEKEGITFITLSPEEQARVKNTCAEAIWAKWIATCKEKGVPGEEFLTRYKAIVKELTE